MQHHARASLRGPPDIAPRSASELAATASGQGGGGSLGVDQDLLDRLRLRRWASG